jgi:hypothetical protein
MSYRVAIDGSITALPGKATTIEAALDEPFTGGVFREGCDVSIECLDVAADPDADEALYRRIAPAVQDGCISYTGEDDHRWRYVFRDGAVTRQDEQRSWPEA